MKKIFASSKQYFSDYWVNINISNRTLDDISRHNVFGNHWFNEKSVKATPISPNKQTRSCYDNSSYKYYLLFRLLCGIFFYINRLLKRVFQEINKQTLANTILWRTSLGKLTLPCVSDEPIRTTRTSNSKWPCSLISSAADLTGLSPPQLLPF